MPGFTVFYCWQNASPGVNRHFIRECLDAAAKAVSTASIQVEIDQDTQDVAGSPLIAETILEKIRNADAVIGDFSIVSKTSGGQAVLNSNVMLEIGYAIRCHSWDRVTGVFNLASGKVEDLPFDLKHRRSVVPYRLRGDAPGGSKESARCDLATALETVLRGWLADGTSKRRGDLEGHQVAMQRELHRLVEHADELIAARQARMEGLPFDLDYFDKLRLELIDLAATHRFLDEHLAEFRKAAVAANQTLASAPISYPAKVVHFCQRARSMAVAAQANLQAISDQ